MDHDRFELYLTTVQKLIAQSEEDSKASQQLLNLIHDHLTENQSDSSLSEFFKGEHAFYSREYAKALKHYLESKSVKQFEFYCYRAAAFIAKTQGQKDKAIAFAKKALMIYPKDYPALSILNIENNSQGHDEHPPKITLGERELEELAGIFEQSSGHEDLFTAEHSPAKNLEGTMNTDASLFSFPKSSDPAMTTALTQRLYPMANEEFKTSSSPLEEIKKELAQQDSPFSFPCCSTDEQELEHRMACFQHSQMEKMTAYREQIKHRRALPDDFLCILIGSRTQELLLSTENSRKASGGYFLRWNQKGIVINPGKGFMQHFYRNGLHIKDIDFVIVTQDHPDTYVDIHEIYELNYQLNRMTHQDLQVIHYYLNPNAYQELSGKLKPNFKQERHTIHHLELFLDSPEIEKISLTPEINLFYFPLSPLEAMAQSHSQERLQKSSLGLRLELKGLNGKRSTQIGYLAGASWSPLIGQHLERCDVLIAGFGNTHANDYTRLSYTDGCLGYFGCYSLFEELAPKLMLCTEFGGREGDISLEIVKKLRHDLFKKRDERFSPSPNILPGDTDLLLDLQQLKIRCSISETFVEPEKVRVTKSSPAFSRLHYLAPTCYL